jgi:hypothetical protein
MSSRFPVLVFCEGSQQFSSWCHENQVNRNDRAKVVYLHSVEQLRGSINPQVVYFGTPQNRRDYQEVKNMIIRNTRPIDSKESNYELKKREIFERIENAVRNFCIENKAEPKTLKVSSFNYMLLKNVYLSDFNRAVEKKDTFKIYGMEIVLTYGLTDEQIKAYE